VTTTSVIKLDLYSPCFQRLGGLHICLRISLLSLSGSSIFLNSEIRFIISLKFCGVLKKLSHVHSHQKTGNLWVFLESVTWTVLIQQLSPHIQSALSNTRSRGLQTWSLLQLPEAWIPPGEPHVAGKRERRWDVFIRILLLGNYGFFHRKLNGQELFPSWRKVLFLV